MLKIVSGGQTGVDRAALDGAIACGIDVGGWCPQGRMAEDGAIPECYPLKELDNAGYSERTLQNVIDSDATLIIYFGYLSGGTEQTLAYCIAERRPYLLIDGEELSRERAAVRVLDFIASREIEVLNVAGPRASGEARAYDYTRAVIEAVSNAAMTKHYQIKDDEPL
ncbi:MAG: putative molybdenum carrier protein [Candidatus Thiodiazotropha sp.]